jgi:hypothetical protein
VSIYIDTDHDVIPAVAPREKTPADVLRHAALVIEERGWTQGDFSSGEAGPYCAMGAIAVALEGDPVPTVLRNPAYSALTRYLGLGQNFGRAFTWNDDDGRTAEEVTSTLRSAADAWEREHR